MGKITKIEVQKRNKNRVNIYIDEVYGFSVNSELVYKEGLKVNLEVDEEKVKKVANEDNKLKCKESALRILQKTYKTEKEMVEKLTLKGYDLDIINFTIDFLKEYNFLNDETYVKMYIKDRLKTQGVSKIKYSLINKGVELDLINNLLESVDRDEERERAIELVTKKYKQLEKRETDKYKLWNKLCRFLVSRGYDYSLAKEVIKQVVNL